MSQFRLKYLLSENDGGIWGGDPTGVDDTPVLRSTEQNSDGSWRLTEAALRSLSVSERNRYQLLEGDIVVTKSSGSDDHIGKSSIVTSDIADLRPAYSNFMQKLRVRKDVCPRFVWHVLNSRPTRHHYVVEASSTSGLGNLTGGILARVPVLRIDLPTQKRIAAFLDRETARVDELIAKKVAFADLILAREEASFLAAVTGRSAAGPRLPSGVEWIGDLPEGWLAPKFTMVARQETGHTPSRKEPDYWIPEECVIPWLSLADVWQLRSGEAVYLHDTAEKISEFGMANSSARLLPKDTVVLSRTASVGFAAIMGCPMATTQDFAGWICGPKIRPKFLYYVLRAMKPEFRRLMMGSTHQTIYMPDIRAFRTPLPPLAEQDRIIDRLDATIGIYRQVHSRIQSSIQTLREYRAALITAAVTGQIDVDTYTKAGANSATLDRIAEDMEA